MKKRTSLLALLAFCAPAFAEDIERVVVGSDGKSHFASELGKPDKARPNLPLPPENFDWVEDLFCIREEQALIVSLDQISNNFYRTGDKKTPVLHLRLVLEQEPVGRPKSETVVWKSKAYSIAANSTAMPDMQAMLTPHTIGEALISGSEDHVRLKWQLVDLSEKKERVLSATRFTPCDSAAKRAGEFRTLTSAHSVEVWGRFKWVDFTGERTPTNYELVLPPLEVPYARQTITGLADADQLIVKTVFKNNKRPGTAFGNRDYKVSLVIRSKDDKSGKATELAAPVAIKVDYDKEKGLEFAVPVELLHRRAVEHSKLGIDGDLVLSVVTKTSYGTDTETTVDEPLADLHKATVGQLFEDAALRVAKEPDHANAAKDIAYLRNVLARTQGQGDADARRSMTEALDWLALPAGEREQVRQPFLGYFERPVLLHLVADEVEKPEEKSNRNYKYGTSKLQFSLILAPVKELKDRVLPNPPRDPFIPLE